MEQNGIVITDILEAKSFREKDIIISQKGQTSSFSETRIDSINIPHGTFGDKRIIEGSGFDEHTTIYFDALIAEVVSWSENQIEVIVPQGQGEVDVRLDYFDLFSDVIFTFDPVPEPKIDEINIPYGTYGNVRIIKGSGFSGYTDIMFGSDSAEVLSWSDDQIEVKVPFGQGAVDVRIGWFDHESDVTFTYMPPEIYTITPDGYPNDEISIKGQYFGEYEGGYEFLSHTYVKFGLSTAEIKTWEDEEIIVYAPSDYGQGKDFYDLYTAVKWLVLLYKAPVDIPLQYWLYTKEGYDIFTDFVGGYLSEQIGVGDVMFPDDGLIIRVKVHNSISFSNEVAFRYIKSDEVTYYDDFMKRIKEDLLLEITLKQIRPPL